MANGVAKQRRIETMQLVCVAFNESLDIPKFLRTGVVDETVVGKPLVLSDELEEQVQAEIDRIRRENPNLPKFKATGGE
jgi:ATP phosphoribosyltransferase